MSLHCKFRLPSPFSKLGVEDVTSPEGTLDTNKANLIDQSYSDMAVNAFHPMKCLM